LSGRREAGKTILLNLIGCLDKPTTGRVIVAGQDLATLTDNGPNRYLRALR
jgi:putative ABC transport system ATP-binding protein